MPPTGRLLYPPPLLLLLLLPRSAALDYEICTNDFDCNYRDREHKDNGNTGACVTHCSPLSAGVDFNKYCYDNDNPFQESRCGCEIGCSNDDCVWAVQCFKTSSNDEHKRCWYAGKDGTFWDKSDTWTQCPPRPLCNGLHCTVSNNVCDPHYYRERGAVGCTPCPFGTENPKGYRGSLMDNKWGVRVCHQCSESNTIGKGDGQGCKPCPENKWPFYLQNGVLVASSQSCYYCELGQYMNLDAANSKQCNDCQVGTYSNTQGALYCDSCPPFSFSSGGATSCTQCALGKYSERGASSCSSCAVNQVIVRERVTIRCEDCELNEYVNSAYQCAFCDSSIPNIGIKTEQERRVCAECKVTWANLEYVNLDGICSNLPVRIIRDDWTLAGEDKYWLDGELKRLSTDQYLNQDDGAITACGCDETFHYAQGCGKNAAKTEVWVYKFDSSYPKPELRDLHKIDSVSAGTSASDYRIYRPGKCTACPTCPDGQYSTCAGMSTGECIDCTTSCEPGHYLSKPSEEEFVTSKQWCLWNITDHYPTQDLMCQKCPAWKAVDNSKYYLVAGCGNMRNFTRWDPSREVTADGERPRSISCDVESDNPDCFVDQRTVPADAHSAGEYLPYCPPGWHVNAGCVGTDTSTAWNPACCERCTTCDLAAGKAVRLHEYAECSGATSADTQDACDSACHVGEYIDGEQCRRCTSCRAGELYFGTDGGTI